MVYWQTGPTPESIAQARETMLRERQQVTAQTGVVIADDGTPTISRVHCPSFGCEQFYESTTPGRELRALASHLRIVHHWKVEKEQ